MQSVYSVIQQNYISLWISVAAILAILHNQYKIIHIQYTNNTYSTKIVHLVQFTCIPQYITVPFVLPFMQSVIYLDSSKSRNSCSVIFKLKEGGLCNYYQKPTRLQKHLNNTDPVLISSVIFTLAFRICLGSVPRKQLLKT